MIINKIRGNTIIGIMCFNGIFAYIHKNINYRFIFQFYNYRIIDFLRTGINGSNSNLDLES